jgi:predicted DCC family thiol-disulfide oxidoreductase YuxK
MKLINSFFTDKSDAIGLSIFRMFYSVILFCEIHQLYQFRHIIYDKDPFYSIGEIDVAFLFYFWFIFIAFLFLGVFTRFTTIINYIFSVIIFSSASQFEYHVFYAYVGLNFLLMFMPISRVFSLDSLLKKIKFNHIGKPYTVDNKVLEINYLVPVFAAIGLVYFDSVFQKLSGKMWMDGLGVWLPSSLPMVVWNDTSFLLNHQWLVTFLGYLVFTFETVFIFIFWFKKWRVPLLLLGIFFHLGILIAYPIPWFALTAVAVYLLLIPTVFWRTILKIIKSKKTLYTFYYDVECPLCNKIVVIITHFDFFHTIQCQTVQGNYLDNAILKTYNEETLLINIHGVTSKGKVYVGYWAYIQLFKSLIYTYPLGLLSSLPGVSFLGNKVYKYIAGNRLTERCTAENCTIPVYQLPIDENQDLLLKGWNQLAFTKYFWKIILVFFILAQSIMIWFSPFVQSVIPFKDSLNKIASIPYDNSKWILVKYFGITHHPVFMYKNHFKGYNHIFKIEYNYGNKKGLVPVLDENGIPNQSYINGALWVNYTFRVNSPSFNINNFEKGTVPYLRYFENDRKVKNLKYSFYVKEITPKEEWSSDFLKIQSSKPWVKVGICEIINQETIFVWNSKMNEILANQK